MKKILAAAALTAAVAAPIALAAPAEAAIPNNWASQTEFNDVRGGWTLAHVNDHFDTRGQFSYQSGNTMSRTYHGWERKIEISVTYKKRWDGAWVVGRDQYSGAWKYAYRKYTYGD